MLPTLLSALLLLFPFHCHATLTLQVWPNTAFAPPSSAVTHLPPAVNLPASLPDYSSLRFTGTIVDSATELVAFEVLSEGGVRLWVDDHLVINAGDKHAAAAATRSGFLRIPFVAGVPQAFRLEYSRWASPSAPTLELRWSGNTTAAAPVPGSAFSPSVSSAEVQRVALRDRLVNPAIPWQTYCNPTMGSHVLMPAGFLMDATLADADTGDVLGALIVFRQSQPALLRAGLHSISGSNYTALTLSAWGSRVCDVSFETTVTPEGDLYFLATSNGTGCARLLLLLTPGMMEERTGTIAASADGISVTAALPGFGSVLATAVGGTPVRFPNATSAVYLALPLGEGAVGYATGSAPPAGGVATMAADIARARGVQAAVSQRYPPALSPIYEAMASNIAWNTLYTPVEGVITSVSRGWDFGGGYTLFDWDTLFLAYTQSLEDGIMRDLALSNTIQIILARTVMGFVPNFASGTAVSFDRTEPQIGAFVLSRLYARWGDGWLVDLLLPSLLSWNDWVWEHRRGEGVLAGPDGHADLIVLGSDPSDPPCEIGGYNTLQAAKYESGLDNSPMYDGDDGASPPGPVRFDNVSTHHMQLYDVGFTALYLSDTEATMSLATVAGRGDLVPALAARFARVQTAMNTHLWDSAAGAFTNKLFNGSFYPRYSPTSFFPLLSGSASDEQAAAMAVHLASPRGFCLNTSHTPAPAADMLSQWWDGEADNAACLTEGCLQARVDTDYAFVRVEALALLPAGGPAAGLLPLTQFLNAATGDHALLAGTQAPGPGYAATAQEGFCWAAPPPPEAVGGWPVTNITLWWSPSRADFKTCGSAACEADTAPDYVPRGLQCFALDASTPDTLPCKFGAPSIARADAAFHDNAYWRGRLWGPHAQLMYWGLARYDHVPAVRAARLALVAQGARVMSLNWRLFSQVAENVNGLIGVAEDVQNADPFYTWGSLFGFISFQEAGLMN